MAKKDIRTYPVPMDKGLSKEELRKMLQDLPKDKIQVVPQGRSGKRKKTKEQTEEN